MRVGWHDEYLRIAPRPEDFPRLFAKKTAMDAAFTDLCDDDVRTVEAPFLDAPMSAGD